MRLDSSGRSLKIVAAVVGALVVAAVVGAVGLLFTENPYSPILLVRLPSSNWEVVRCSNGRARGPKVRYCVMGADYAFLMWIDRNSDGRWDLLAHDWQARLPGQCEEFVNGAWKTVAPAVCDAALNGGGL